MNIITISREFGSGGRELGKRLSELLGYDYYDKEILTEIAARHNMNENLVKEMLLHQQTPAVQLNFRHTFTSPLYVHFPNTDLLLEQKRIIEEIAQKGRDFVIIGRNADILLKDFSPFNVFVTADMDAKIKRCMDRAEDGENLSPKEIRKKIIKIDKARKRSRFLLTEKDWGHKNSYNLIVNTTDWDIKALSEAVAEVVKRFFGAKNH